MREMPDDLRLVQSLRDGLQALSVPEFAPDFDARILAALHAPAPRWRLWWKPARPLLLGASCSLLVTLTLLHWTLSAPVSAPSPPVLAAAPSRAPSLDSLLDSPGLRAGSLAAARAVLPPVPPPDRRPEPPHHARVGRGAYLIV